MLIMSTNHIPYKLFFSFIVLIFCALPFFGSSLIEKKPMVMGLQIDTSSSSKLFFDVTRANMHVSYIYAPGMMGTEMMMGRYCPSFTAITGEKIDWKLGGHVIGSPHTAVIFSEINLEKPNGFTWNPLTAILNGLRRDLFPLAQRFLEEKYDFSVKDNSRSSKSVVNYSFDFRQANIGQAKDIHALHKTYHEHLKKYSETNVVLYGDSRGAVSIFNFIAQCRPTRVKAAVLDGIFDDVPHCIKHFLYNDKNESTEQRLHDIVSFIMGSYKKNGPFPRQLVEKITDEIPLLFVTSLKDGLVAPQCTIYLYNRLKERGHKKIHLLILKKSLHPCYMIDDKDDKNMYETVVHAFYKQYGLPHNSIKAFEGQKDFLQTQPSIESIQQIYNLPSCKFC